MIKHIQAHWRLCAIAVILSLGLLAFHYAIGTPRGASFDYNLSWYEAFRSAFWRGDLYPRFAPELWYGNGGLDFLFYGPLPFWFATLVGEISCSACTTSQAFSVSGAWMLILSGITFFIFARRFFEPAWAGFGAVLYVLLPFHYLINWYIGQTIGALMALAILPVLALAVSKLIEDRKGGILFALSFAALALSHLPTTLIVLHLLIVFVVCAAFQQEQDWQKRFAVILRFAPWGLLGVGLSAFYWLPAIALLDSVSSDKLYSSYYDSTRWLYLDGQPENDPTKTLKFKFVLFSVAALALSAGYLQRQAKDRSVLWLWIVVPSVFAVFLMTIISYPVWQFWILNKIQFPDRALVVTDLSIALASIVILKGALAQHSGALIQRTKMIAAIAGSALLLAFLHPINQSAQIIEKGWDNTDAFLPVAPPEYVPPPFLELAFDRFRSRDTSHLSNADSFNVFFDEMKAGYAAAHQALQDDAPGAVLTPHINDRLTLQIDLASAASVRVPIPSWKYWRARTSDGIEISLEQDAALGVMRLPLPAGQTEVEIYLIETPPQRLGSAISLLALFSLLLIVAAFRFRNGTPVKSL